MVFVLPYIPLLFYIYPLLPCIVLLLPYNPVPFYIYPLFPCIVLLLSYIPVPFYIYPLLPCIVFVISYIPVLSTSTLYSLVSSLYSHISPYPSTYPLYSLVSSLYSHISPYPSTSTLYSHVSSLYSYISPYPSTYTLYSLVSSLPLPYIPVPFFISPLLPCIVVSFLHSHISLWLFTFPLYIAFCLFSYNTFMNLQGNGLGNSPVKPRSKRSYHHRHSTKLSIKDLALELAKKHVSTVEPR